MKKFLLFFLLICATSGVLANSQHVRKQPVIRQQKTGVDLRSFQNTDDTHRTLTRADNDFYGYMVYSSVDYDLGIYSITPGNDYKMAMVDPYEQLGFDLMPFNGWYTNGLVNGLSMFYLDPYTPMGYFYYSLDFETGKLLEYKEYENWIDLDLIFEICTLNPVDNKIYGYAVDTHNLEWEYYWAWASPNDPTNIHVMQKAGKGENCISLCYRPDEKCFYGITTEFDFVKISLSGEQTYITNFPYYEDAAFVTLQSGLIWSEADGVFYWNGQIYSFLADFIYGTLYSISPTGELTMVEQYSLDQQFSFFFTTETYVNPLAPYAPTIESLNFEGPSLSGKMIVSMPSQYGNGNDLPQNITYEALLNDEVYTTGSAIPGSTVEIPFVVDVAGEYTFSISVAANGVSSNPTSRTLYVGYDTPKSPENVLLSPYSITWDATTSGVHNGYINLNNISYELTLNGEILGTVKDLSYTIDLLKNPELAHYTATVTAISDEIRSQPAKSNSIVAGQPVSLPLNYTPTQEEFENMTIYNTDNDWYVYEGKEITWEMSPYGLFSGGTEWASDPMDDYIFLPPVYLTPGENNSNLKFECGKHMDWYPWEYLNVVVATNPCPEGVIDQILSDYSPKVYLSDKDNKWTEWDSVDLNFTVPSAGVYYIGFQCISEPQQYGIYIRNIVLSSIEDAGVESLTDNKVSISSGNGIIYVKGESGISVKIMQLDGKILYQNRTTSEIQSYNLPSGIYIVNADNKYVKVIVK